MPLNAHAFQLGRLATRGALRRLPRLPRPPLNTLSSRDFRLRRNS